MKVKSKISEVVMKKKKKVLRYVKDKGLYLSPHKKIVAGIKEKKKEGMQIISNRSHSTNDLLRYVCQLGIQNIRGVFMRDTLTNDILENWQLI